MSKPKIPKYVQDLMGRAEYEFDSCTKHEEYAVGYTLRIHKYSWYQTCETFEKEIRRLVAWANRFCETSGHILSIPTRTHHDDQTAVVTIYDPTMKHIEEYILPIRSFY